MKKTIYSLLTLLILLSISFNMSAQDAPKDKCIVLNIDAQGLEVDAPYMGNLVRMELDKISKYEVVDRYDVAYLVEKNNLKIDNCYGKICLLEIGNQLQVDYMFTGSVERFGETIIMTFRLINVANQVIEKSQVIEFQNFPKELQTMVNISVARFFDLEVNSDIERYLTKKNDYESTVNNPDVNQLNLSGPRMGITFLTGEAAQVYKAPLAEGGYDNYPFFTSFGYQFEVQYLNEGNFQALFEFLPLISGLDQGKFIPSLTALHGLRNNKNGLEFAFGPTITGYQYANGYTDPDGNWIIRSEWNERYPELDAPDITEKRIDSRGDFYGIRPGFVFAAGFTLKSGKLNIPINAYVVPNRKSTRFGISLGFNVKR